MTLPTPALLALADGSVFRGVSIGIEGAAVGEVVFNTAMTGYQEILTDPSYREQMVTLTYPHIGNYGVNDADLESEKVQLAGLILREVPRPASSWRSRQGFRQYLQQQKVVAIAGIDTRRLTRLLRDKGALPDLTDVLKRARDVKVKRAALTSIAMLPDPASRPLYEQYLHDKDENLRGAAAEGFARLRDPNELAMLEQAWQDEGKTSPRLSLAFAQVMLGRKDVSEFSPLRFLIDNLNSAAYNGDALPFLVELARDEGVRTALYGPLSTGTKDEKIGLARVLARSGDAESVAPLQKLSGDSDAAVAQEGLRALRTLQARM